MIIDFLLDEYWTSSETKEYVDAAVSGISMDEYWTSAETKEYVDAVENHINSVEEVTSRALNDLNDRVVELSGSSVDLSSYWTSAETKDYVDSAISGVSVDLSGYYTSGQTDAAISAATQNYPTRTEVTQEINTAVQNKVSSSTITTIWTGTQADYDLIDTPDPNTFYVITGTTV